MRARHLGWRHVAVPGVYVGHLGTRSFNAARDDLMRRNLEILNRLHVGYDQLIARWQLRDPLGESRRRIDLARLRKLSSGGDTVLLITHNRDGGMRQHVVERLKVIARTDRRAILLRPENKAAGQPATYVLGLTSISIMNSPISGSRCRRASEFVVLPWACGVHEIEVHSLTGHDDSVVDLSLICRSRLIS